MERTVASASTPVCLQTIGPARMQPAPKNNFFSVVNVFYIDRIRREEFAVPPFFKEHLQNVLNEAGKVVRFRCNVGGFPSPEVEWFKGHDRITEVQEEDNLLECIGYKYYSSNDNGNLILVIANILPEDMGPYTCKIRNKVGEARSTAMLYTLSPLTQTPTKATEGFKADQKKKKVVIEETITIVERRTPISAGQVSLNGSRHSDVKASQDNTVDGNKMVVVKPVEDKEDTEVKNLEDVISGGQKLTLMFAVPTNCETKGITVKTSSRPVLTEDEGQEPEGKLRPPECVESQPATNNEDTLLCSPESTSSHSASQGELSSDNEITEGELKERQMWIRCGESSDSDFRRNSIPCPLPPCFQENNGETGSSPADSGTQSRQSSQDDDGAIERRTRYRKTLAEEEEEEELGVEDGKDTSLRRGSLLSDMSAASALFSSSNGIHLRKPHKPSDSSEDRTEYLDVFEDESSIPVGNVEDESSKSPDIFAEDGLETYADISPISPDFVSYVEYIKMKNRGPPGPRLDSSRDETTDEVSEMENENHCKIILQGSESSTKEGQNQKPAVEETIQMCSLESTTAERTMLAPLPQEEPSQAGGVDEEGTAVQLPSQDYDKRNSLVREMAQLNVKLADTDAAMELDELIAKLLEFSEESYVFVSSLKIGSVSQAEDSTIDVNGANERSTDKTVVSEQTSEFSQTQALFSQFAPDEHVTKTTHQQIPPSEMTSKEASVPHKPVFVIPLQDVEVDVEDDVVLNISVTGFPPPRITWFRDGHTLDEKEDGVISDNLKRHSAVYTCVASNECGECTTSCRLNVRPASTKKRTEELREDAIVASPVQIRAKKSNESPSKRRSQIISASLVDYLRSKAKSLQQTRTVFPIQSSEENNKSELRKPSPEEMITRDQSPPCGESLGRDDLTLRRGSILSLGSVSTTSYASADEELTSSDTAVWEEVLSTGEEDFMSTDEFFTSKRNSDDEYFLPRPSTPVPGREPPTLYEITSTRSLKPFTRQMTFSQFISSSSEEMETAQSGNTTPVAPRSEEIFSIQGEMESQPPRFLCQLEDKVFAKGATCMLSCSILGYPTPQVAWYRNGIRIQALTPTDATSPRPFLTSMSFIDSPPYAVSQRFNVTSEKRVQDSSEGDKTECSVHTLTISDCRITDTGEYTVTAMNVYGSVVTTAQVNISKTDDGVLDPATHSQPTFVVSLCDSDGMLGEEAVMTFQVKGYPEPEITVFHKKVEMNSDKIVLMKHEQGKYVITVTDLHLEDEGEVRILAKNLCGSAECYAELFVDERTITPTPGKYCIPQWSEHNEDIDFGLMDIRHELATQVIAPYFDDITEDVTTSSGSTASFLVRVYAWPAPSVLWYKEGEPIREGFRFSFDSTDFGTHVLKIRDVTEEDAGIYTCVVENSEGKVFCKAELNVSDHPSSPTSSDGEKKTGADNRKLKDHYVVHKDIAFGAFSIVRLVRGKANGTAFAAKYIKCPSSFTREKFKSEIEILSTLSHDHIVGYQDFFETKKHLVLVLEYLDSEWFEYLLQKPNVYEVEIASHVRQVCAGLRYLHENNVLHLDLRPENLMMTCDGNALKIIDFGSAHKMANNLEVEWDYGNPEFVSPEVVMSHPVTPASDMWSIGVVVYVAISGISPFLGESDQATIRNVQDGKWNYDTRWFATVTEMAKDFISKLVVLDPEQRLKADEAESHLWLLSSSQEQNEAPLPDGRLKYFLSRRKWQRSLVTPKTSLVLRSISSLLRGEYDSTSIAVSRTALSDDINSSTVTESDDEIDDVTSKENFSSSAAYRARAARMQETTRNIREFIHDQSKDSIVIENWIDQHAQDDGVDLPKVTVNDTTPKASPESARKKMQADRSKIPEKDDIATDFRQTATSELGLKTADARSPQDSSHLRLLNPRRRLKLIGKKVSFEDELTQPTEHETKLPSFREEESQSTSRLISEEEPPTPPPVPQMPTVSRQTTAVLSNPGVTLDRPKSVSKLLKEDRRPHNKVRKVSDTDTISTKDKIKKKLSSMTSRRQRSFDVPASSSSSEEDVRYTSEKADSSKDPLTPTRSKFSFFSRRKRPITKGGSLDSALVDTQESLQVKDEKPELTPAPPRSPIPIKGILKRGRSNETSSQSDSHLQRSLQKSRSPSPNAMDANKEGFFGPKRYQRKPLIKGVSLDLDIVAEASAGDSVPNRQRHHRKASAQEKRRHQMRRGSSAESALPPTPPNRSRVSGLRGPLLEKDMDTGEGGDAEPTAGMFLRRSLPNVKGKLQTHTRSLSASHSLQSPGSDRGKFSPLSLSPRGPPMTRHHAPTPRAFFNQSLDMSGLQLQEGVANTFKGKKACSLQLPTTSRSLLRSTSYDKSVSRRQRSSERRQLNDSYAPYIKSGLLNQGVTSHQTCVTLNCVIDASPLAEVVWYKDGYEVNSSDKFEIISEASMSKHQLKLRNLDLPHDFGEYSCEASNAVGVVRTSCKLMAAVVPAKPSAPELSGNDERSVWVTWNPPDNCPTSPISYMLQYREMAGMKWVTVQNAIEGTLYRVENLRPTTSYRFRVRAMNNAGVGPFSKVSQRIQLDPRTRTDALEYSF